MRLSAKGRYALAATTYMAKQHKSNEYITLISISKMLDISKIYLEQVFSLLKHAGIVNSTKGSQGGYQLSKSTQKLTVYDILIAVETTLFENTEETIQESAPDIEGALKGKIFNPLDKVMKDFLMNITLYDLVLEIEKHNPEQNFMFFI